MLFNPKKSKYATLIVTGRLLAHNKWSAHCRAEAAANLVLGNLDLTEPTVGQAAALCRASLSLTRIVLAERKDGPDFSAAFSPVTDLIDAWVNATEAERVEFIKAVGIDQVFDAVVAAA